LNVLSQLVLLARNNHVLEDIR
jgi:hypothetical protein